MPISVIKDLFSKTQLINASRGLDCKGDDPRCGPCDHNSKGIPPTAFNEDSE